MFLGFAAARATASRGAGLSLFAPSRLSTSRVRRWLLPAAVADDPADLLMGYSCGLAYLAKAVTLLDGVENGGFEVDLGSVVLERADSYFF